MAGILWFLTSQWRLKDLFVFFVMLILGHSRACESVGNSSSHFKPTRGTKRDEL